MQICSSCWIILYHLIIKWGMHACVCACVPVCKIHRQCCGPLVHAWSFTDECVISRGVRAVDVECLSERMASAIRLRDSSPLRQGFNHDGLCILFHCVTKTFVYVRACVCMWVWLLLIMNQPTDEAGSESVICDTGKCTRSTALKWSVDLGM